MYRQATLDSKCSIARASHAPFTVNSGRHQPRQGAKPSCRLQTILYQHGSTHRQSRIASSLFIVAALESGEEIEMEMMERMEKCVSSVKRNFGTLRTGRASPDMLDRISVDYYGAPTPIRQLAGISVPESSLLVIQPYDKGSMQAIEKAIQTSDLGLPPNNDGKVIRLNIPALTQERRKDFVKQAGKMAEDGRVAVRNVRKDGMTAVKKLKNDGLGEDEAKAWEETVQEQTDDAVKQINELLKKKEDELTKL